jgi:uncharacterized protein
MTTHFPDAAASLVRGTVVHKRLRPHTHALSYAVFSLLLDLDRLDEAPRVCRLFAHNRFGLIAFHDRDHLAAPSGSIADTARHIFREAGFATDDARVFLLAYPRVFGFAFNPLAVFYLVAPDETIRAVIYEVRNTFGGRVTYVTAAGEPANGVYAHGHSKEMVVSPFAAVNGRYGFRLAIDPARVLLAVNFRDADGPLIKTHFSGVSEPLTTASAASVLARMPLTTFRVVAGIHWEALKLWLKGVPLVPRPRVAPAGSVRASVVSSASAIPPSRQRLTYDLKDDNV